MDELFDVAVIGGGPAGLSAALTLARARRSVVVVDAGEPRNAPAKAVHGFFTRDGTPPSELLATGRAEASSFGARIIDGSVIGATAKDDRFALDLADGTSIACRRILVTSGLVDELPELPGVRELWGDSVLHCPYCHGWEVRDHAIGVLATTPMATHQALLFRQLSDDVVLFAHTHPPSEDQLADLAARDVTVVEGEVDSLAITGAQLAGVRMRSGRTIPRDAVVVAPKLVARSTVLESLGVDVVEVPDIGWRVATDEIGRTNVPGVWAAGNVTDLSAQVVVAAAGGQVAGAQINADLVAEDVRVAAAKRSSGDGARDETEPQPTSGAT